MKICYTGIYKPTIARNSILLEGLRKNDVEVVECIDESGGLNKYINIAKKCLKLSKNADVILVGFTSGVLVPLVRIISKKPIVFNASHSLYEGIIIDRQTHNKFSLKALWIWFIDFLAFNLAHLSLVETEGQRKFISSTFFVPLRKLKVLFTGAEESLRPDSSIGKLNRFTAVFRGAFLPATGVRYIIEAARILKDNNVSFLILGRGPEEGILRKVIDDYGLKNVDINAEFMPIADLKKHILSSHVMLGQFSKNERMERTIQNKTFEALALGMPYITRVSKSNLELLTDRKNCLFVKPGDAEDLARAIVELKDNHQLRESLGLHARQLYMEIGRPELIGRQFIDFIRSLLKF